MYDWRATLATCPAGWHLSSGAEWKQLETALGMSYAQADDFYPVNRGTNQGTQMKTTSDWHKNGNGTNTSRFSGLPGGYRFSNGFFYYIESFGYWWSSAESSYQYDLARGLSFNTGRVCRNSSFKNNGFSVRCIKD